MPFVWLRDSSFWREVMARTLSALITTGIGFVFARAVGLFPHISWWSIAKASVPFVVVLVIVAVVASMQRGLPPMQQNNLINGLNPLAGGAWWSQNFAEGMLEAEREHNKQTRDKRSRPQ